MNGEVFALSVSLFSTTRYRSFSSPIYLFSFFFFPALSSIASFAPLKIALIVLPFPSSSFSKKKVAENMDFFIMFCQV